MSEYFKRLTYRRRTPTNAVDWQSLSGAAELPGEKEREAFREALRRRAALIVEEEAEDDALRRRRVVKTIRVQTVTAGMHPPPPPPVATHVGGTSQPLEASSLFPELYGSVSKVTT